MIAAGRLDLGQLFAEDMLGDDLDAWLAEVEPDEAHLPAGARSSPASSSAATAAARRPAGRSPCPPNLIYDVLRRHDPHHILIEAAWTDAATGLLDIARLGDFLRRVKGRIRHQALDSVSPLSMPILLEIGREAVSGLAREELLREAADELIGEATGGET